MRITQEADYALRIILTLSKSGKEVRTDAKTIATQENVPQRFALKILRKLTKAGLVKSFRGVQGGYSIDMEPEEITILDVISAIDGPININRCLEDPASCNKQSAAICTIHNALGEVQDTITQKLGGITFRSLIRKHEL